VGGRLRNSSTAADAALSVEMATGIPFDVEPVHPGP